MIESFWKKVGLYKELVNCHFQYLFQKTNVWILIVMLLFIVFANTMTYVGLKEYAIGERLYTMYVEECMFVHKLLGIFYSIFVFSYTGLYRQMEYAAILISKRIPKRMFIHTKGISIIVLLGWYLAILVSMTVLFYILVEGSSYLQFRWIVAYLHFGILLLIYGCWGWCIVQLTNQLYGMILPYACFLIGNIFLENETKTTFQEIFFVFFPNTSTKNNFLLLYPNIVVLFGIVLYLSNLFLFQVKDTQ